MDSRGYSRRTSVLLFNYFPSIPYKFVLPNLSYPSAAPYANLNKYYRKLVKNRTITSRFMKKLLYPEYLKKKVDLSEVKRRRHKTEFVLIPNSLSRRASIIECDSDTDSSSNTNSISDDDYGKFYRKNNIEIESSTSSGSKHSSSSSNPFGYIRYYNPQTGQQREETKYESFVDYGEVSTPINVLETEQPTKSSVVLTSTAKVQLVHQTSETSEVSSILEPKPYMACEDLVNLDSDTKISTSIKKLSPPSSRQSLPTKFVANKFNDNNLTTVYVPPWQSSSDINIPMRSTFLPKISEQVSSSSSSTTNTTHSSSLDLAINPVPLPDTILAELLYNFDQSNTPEEETSMSKISSKTVIKPPTMFCNSEDKDIQKNVFKRRSSIQMNPANVEEQKFNPLRRCISYQLVQVEDPLPGSSHQTCCTCMEACDSSRRSSDSGMAGSCSLNSPEFPPTDYADKRRSCESLNLYNINDYGDLSSLGSNIVSFSELEASKFESQCQCTSPFGSTPRTSCQPSISENVFTGSRDSVQNAIHDVSTIPTPPTWESINQIHSKLMQIRAQSINLKKKRCPSSMGNGKISQSVDCILDDPKNIEHIKTTEQNKTQNEIYKSGLYAHWWLKAKIPPEVVKAIYEETRSPTAGKGTRKCCNSVSFAVLL